MTLQSLDRLFKVTIGACLVVTYVAAAAGLIGVLQARAISLVAFWAAAIGLFAAVAYFIAAKKRLPSVPPANR